MAEIKTKGIPSGWTPEVQREMDDINHGTASQNLARELVNSLDTIAAKDTEIAALLGEVERLREALELNAWRRTQDGSLCWCGRQVHERYCVVARSALKRSK